MKNDIIKKLSPYDVAMIGRLYPMTQTDMQYIMWYKGDIEIPASTHPTVIITTIYDEPDDHFNLPKGKSMKAANRRKRTYHKQQQREKKYRDLGYPIERFSASERGKMREGVGMFPETQHQYSMYNRGKKKVEKPITTKQAISMMEHERWLDEQDAITEYKEAERIGAMDCIDDLMCEIDGYNRVIEHDKELLVQLLEKVEEVKKNISFNEMNKAFCLKKVVELKDFLSE